jgi:hypothetical protein
MQEGGQFGSSASPESRRLSFFAAQAARTPRTAIRNTPEQAAMMNMLSEKHLGSRFMGGTLIGQ